MLIIEGIWVCLVFDCKEIVILWLFVEKERNYEYEVSRVMIKIFKYCIREVFGDYFKNIVYKIEYVVVGIS